MSKIDPKQTFGNEVEDGDEAQPSTMSLLGGIAKGSDSIADGDLPLGLEPSTAEERNFLGQTKILIAVVVVIAVGAIYAMRLTQSDMTADASAQATETKMDNWLTKLQSPDLMDPNDPLRAAKMNSIFNAESSLIVERIGFDVSQTQVPVRFVKKNPFMLSLAGQQAGDGGSSRANLNAAAVAQQERQAQLQAELDKCHVNSIMTSSKGKFAMIDSELYQVGNHLGSFVIEDMDDMTIILRHGQTKFFLHISNGTQKSPRRR